MKRLHFALIAVLGTLLLYPVQQASAQLPGRPSDPAFNRLANAPKSGNGKWSGSLGFGMTVSRGNSKASQASLTVEAIRALRDSRVVLRGLLVRNTNNDDTTADNGLAQARYERNFATNWFGFGDLGLERDRFQDLTLRQSYAAGAGYRLVNSREFQSNIYSGLAYTIENHHNVADARGFEPMIGNDINYVLSENASIAQRLVIFPKTVGAGGVRSVFQIDLNTRLAGRFGLQLSVLNKYRQHVQATEKHTDTTIFTGITAGF